MNICKMMEKGKWIFTLDDKSKWVLDFDNMVFDNYNWYKKVGTLESELTNIDMFIKKAVSAKKIEGGK